MLFELVDHREILHRNVAFSLSVTEQLIATEPKMSRAFTGREIRSHYPKPDGPFATQSSRAGRAAGCPLEERRRSMERQLWAQSGSDWPKGERQL